MLLGYVLVLLSAFGFGLLPIFAIFAYDSGMGVPTLLFLRFAFATVLFFSYILIKMRGWKITGKQWLALFLLGGVLYTMQATDIFQFRKAYTSTACFVATVPLSNICCYFIFFYQ